MEFIKRTSALCILALISSFTVISIPLMPEYEDSATDVHGGSEVANEMPQNSSKSDPESVLNPIEEILDDFVVGSNVTLPNETTQSAGPTLVADEEIVADNFAADGNGSSSIETIQPIESVAVVDEVGLSDGSTVDNGNSTWDNGNSSSTETLLNAVPIASAVEEMSYNDSMTDISDKPPAETIEPAETFEDSGSELDNALINGTSPIEMISGTESVVIKSTEAEPTSVSEIQQLEKIEESVEEPTPTSHEPEIRSPRKEIQPPPLK